MKASVIAVTAILLVGALVVVPSASATQVLCPERGPGVPNFIPVCVQLDCDLQQTIPRCRPSVS